jgi:hypothetical protein
MPTTKPLVPETSSFKVEIVIEKMKKYKSPATDQILAELIQVGADTLCSFHKLINSILNEQELPQQWKESNFFFFPWLHSPA